MANAAVAGNGVGRVLFGSWQVTQFASPFAFAAIIIIMGVWGNQLVPVPQDVDAAVKMATWLGTISYAYMFIQGMTAATQSGSKYLGRAMDIGLSVIPVIALAAVLVLFWSHDDMTLNVIQRKFLWSAAWAAAFDMIVCTIVAFRIAMRSIGFGADS